MTTVEGLHATSSGAYFVTLSWQAPGGISAVDVYRVRCWSEKSGFQNEHTYTVHTNATVRNLQPRTVYLFAVRIYYV